MTKIKSKGSSMEKKDLSIIEILEKKDGWIEAQKVFEGYTDKNDTDSVEKFYMELRELINTHKVKVKREGDIEYLKKVERDSFKDIK
jgi:hypothetical protein